MPISVKTMRDIWDEGRIKSKVKKETMRTRKRVAIPKKVRGEYFDYLKVRKKSLAEIRKLRSDYLERKKYSLEIFDFIEGDLGEAGFFKI